VRLHEGLNERFVSEESSYEVVVVLLAPPQIDSVASGSTPYSTELGVVYRAVSVTELAKAQLDDNAVQMPAEMATRQLESAFVNHPAVRIQLALSRARSATAVVRPNRLSS